ncbi:MAG: hypothetical protein HQ501_05735 [Rhodospirillales bacterium]|nr:hypothetical protein [Rhodospirillales bacterium]
MDVGTGAGFLPHILKYNGFDNVDAFDIPEASQGFDDSCRVLKVTKTEFTIEPQIPMKNFGQKYDIIACGMLQFDNNHNTQSDTWKIDDWLFFLKDVHDHQLLDDGFIYLGFNVTRSEEVTSLFKDYGDENARTGNSNVKLTRENIRQCLS